MSTQVTNAVGDVMFINQYGQLHSTTGWAIKYIDGTIGYWVNGKRDRKGGPAVVYPKHSPVMIKPDEYWENGVLIGFK